MTYGRPGVYVTERLLPAPIASSTTTTSAGACVGEFAQGPKGVTLVTSWFQFVNLFGGYNAAYPATFGVGEFFKNGGTELYVNRVVSATATQATCALKDSVPTTVATFTAIEYGSDGTNLRIVSALSRVSGGVNYYNITVLRDAGLSDFVGSTFTTANAADDIVLEQFQNVRFDDAGATTGDYAPTVINGVSNYVTVTDVTGGTGAPADGTFPFTGTGLDGSAVALSDYTAALPLFLTVPRTLVLFAPEVLQPAGLGATDGATFQISLGAFAANNNHFAVLDVATTITTSAAALTAAGAISTGITNAGAALSNTAVYFPGIYIADPVGRSSQSVRLLGAAGSVVGLYLATDKLTGPFKAPAGLNAQISTAVASQVVLSSADLDSLNSSQHPLNAVRNLPGVGVAVMGARTLQQDGTASRYVNMRRSLIFLRSELERITQFALFENNDERLWARVRTSVGVFLNDYRNRGGLRGTTPADAYFVKCDGENNTASDIQNGIVNIEVGVALEYPAEFISITLTQKTVS